ALASEMVVYGGMEVQADADFRRGDTAAAESALRHALEKLEQRREKVAPVSYRVSFFDQAQPLYDRMAALQMHLGKPEHALEVLERFRARALLDQTRKLSAGDAQEGPAAPLGWRQLCRRIPERS